jgi:poly-gamma-glutamate synthesis protein (capsule biosynthesis protein)
MKKRIAGHIAGAAVLLSLGVVLLWPAEVKMPEALISLATPTEEPLSVLFVGDIMLDRAVAQYARQEGDEALFAGAKSLFNSADLLVGNLEGSITTNASIAEQDPKILKFTFDPRFAKLLRDIGFDAVSLANNHALDFGTDGYDQTLDFLHQEGIAPFGHPLNTKDLSTTLIFKGQTLCLVGYHSLFDPESAWVAAEIKKLRPTCDRVIVFAHWGEEYSHEPTAHQTLMAHTFVDLGADLVIGAHPHVVQPLEVYKNRVIFYSLGNFLFDQGFQPEVKRGVAVRVEFASSSTRFMLAPVNTFKQVSIAGTTTAAAVLADLGVDEFSFELPQ